MKIYDKVLNKIDERYVTDNYVQLMLKYKNYLMIYGNKNLMYYNNEHNSSYNYKNVYLGDTRKEVFPDPDIIEYYDMSLFKSKRCVNQVFDFEKDYIKINDGVIYQMTAYKDENDAYIYTKILNGYLCNMRVKNANRMEIANYLQFGSFDGDLNKYVYTDIFDLGGDLHNKWIESEDSILDREKEELTRIINSNRSFSNSIRDELLKSVSKLDSVSPFNFPGRFMIKMKDNNDIEIEYYIIRYLANDYYEITLADIPVTKENLSVIKSNLENTKIKTYQVPNISRIKERKFTNGILK